MHAKHRDSGPRSLKIRLVNLITYCMQANLISTAPLRKSDTYVQTCITLKPLFWVSGPSVIGTQLQPERSATEKPECPGSSVYEGLLLTEDLRSLWESRLVRIIVREKVVP
jgi:hypothetical protein